jgi:dienelactone hydrolase
MSIQTKTLSLDRDGRRYEGLLAWDDARDGPLPGVLVSHTIRGRTKFEDDKARDLAALGYAALTVDLYGVETRDSDIEDFRKLMNWLKADRRLLQQQLQEWLALLGEQDEVTTDKIAAIGFCFGGLCVLDIARSGTDIRGVASFHGIFTPPRHLGNNRIKARVLVMHGWEDPLATPDEVVALASELTKQGADWQIHAYGNTLHAFTNPAANDSSAGTVYHASADRRSWRALQDFLNEIF